MVGKTSTSRSGSSPRPQTLVLIQTSWIKSRIQIQKTYDAQYQMRMNEAESVEMPTGNPQAVSLP